MTSLETMRLTVEPGERRGKSFEVGGMGVIFKIFGDETGQALAVVEHPVGPRVLIPPHTHGDTDEYSYVLEGEIGARIGDRVVKAPAGTYVFKPRHVMHTFWNATDKPARILEILSPAKFEKFFEDAGDLFKNPGPDTPARLGALAASYNCPQSMEWVPQLRATYGLKLMGEP
jgi:quercetin dioxygenase-like cupin family protein